MPGTAGVLFVCSGNYCRSPMAEALFSHWAGAADLTHRFRVASAATGSWHLGKPPHGTVIALLQRHGVAPPDGKRAQLLTPALVRGADWLVGMNAHHLASLTTHAPAPGARLLRLLDALPEGARGDVPDPFPDGDFAEVFRLIHDGTRALLETIRRERGW